MNEKIFKLTETSLMIAISIILHMIIIFRLPYGGAVTFASSIPLIIIAINYGIRWGVISGIIFSFTNIFLGFFLLPTKNLISFFIVLILDYIIPFGFIGFTPLFNKIIKNKYISLFLGVLVVFIVRFLCRVISGVIVFSSYSPENTPVLIYSLLYNLSYLLPELIITEIFLMIIIKIFKLNNFNKRKIKREIKNNLTK